MRTPRPFPRLLLAAAIVALAGCGSNFDLPTESGNRTIPPDGSYQMINTWTGLDGVRDLLLTQGGGSQLFVLFNHGGTGTGPRGSVAEYSRTLGTPIGAPFPGLFNPTAICAGTSAPASTFNRAFVLDEGDTCLARQNPQSGTCDTLGGFGLRITQPQYYWKVKEYDLLGAARGEFSDTTLAFVTGIAGDYQGNVYVAGVAILRLPTSDPRVFERAYGFRVYRYARGPIPGGGNDPNVTPAGSWHRDPDFEIRQGTGVGAVVEPRGMHWSAPLGSALFVADLGNFRAEKIRDGNVALPDGSYYHTLAFPSAPVLEEPLDVVSDLAGFFYVADAGGPDGAGQVLRYSDTDRDFVQRVDVELNSLGLPLQRPVSVAADGDFVYVADNAAGQLIRYRRRS